MSLLKIFKQLDVTRLSLHSNLEALDDDLPETYDEFIRQLRKLNKLTKKLEKDLKEDR